MRLIPIITAILVSAALYLIVFERDKVLAFARGETATAAQAGQERAAESEAAAKTSAPQAEIGVVALRSRARAVDSAVIVRGQSQAARMVQLRAETSAPVVSEPLRKGTAVKAGDVLCRLDPGTREAALSEARARLDEARAALPAAEARLQEAISRRREAEINYNAAKRLIGEGFTSETRLAATRSALRGAEAAVATARSGLKGAHAAIAAARAAVAAAEREISRLTIRAPFAGLLETDTAELGSLLQPGSLCATVIQLDPIKLVGYVSETEIDRVQTGARAGALLISGRRVEGRVIFVARTADPRTRTFTVEIEVANPDLSIRDGQTAEIAIAAEGTKAHLLPQSALTLNNEGALGVRLVGPDDIVRFASVEVLRDTPEGVWVTGLPERANVIVRGQDFVTAGVRVRPTWRESAQ